MIDLPTLLTLAGTVCTALVMAIGILWREMIRQGRDCERRSAAQVESVAALRTEFVAREDKLRSAMVKKEEDHWTRLNAVHSTHREELKELSQRIMDLVAANTQATSEHTSNLKQITAQFAKRAAAA